jgi:hypothetical protein
MRTQLSRVRVGFNRLGIVLGTPFLLVAAVLAFLQWQNPTGGIAVKLPEGTRAWAFGEEPDGGPAQQLIAKQRAQGFDLPAGMMLVGLPLGTVRKDQIDWTKFQLPDGREIGIALTPANKADEIARRFLLNEQAAGRAYSDKDQIELDGVRVVFLKNPLDPYPLPPSPWLKQRHDWTWALVALCLGVSLYLAMRALGWVIDGFAGSRRET